MTDLIDFMFDGTLWMFLGYLFLLCECGWICMLIWGWLLGLFAVIKFRSNYGFDEYMWAILVWVMIWCIIVIWYTINRYHKIKEIRIKKLREKNERLERVKLWKRNSY